MTTCSKYLVPSVYRWIEYGHLTGSNSGPKMPTGNSFSHPRLSRWQVRHGASMNQFLKTAYPSQDMTEFRGNEMRMTGMGDGKVEKERRKFGKLLKEMEEILEQAEIANNMDSIDPYKDLETLISDSSLNKLIQNTKFEQVANTLLSIIKKQHRLCLQQTDTMLFMAQQKTVRALKERQDTLNLVKSLQNTLQLEAQYQENIFSQIPRLREMLNDYDKSSESLQQEEKELKKLLDQQYQRLQNSQHSAFEVEDLREQLDLLKGTLTDEEDHIKRPGISEASIKLGETLRQMTSFEKAHAGKVTDYIEGLERRRVLEAICGGNGGRIDEAMIDDIIRRVVSVQKKTAEKIFAKYNLKTVKKNKECQTDPIVEQRNEEHDAIIRRYKRKKQDLKDEMFNYIKKINGLDAEFQSLTKKYSQLSEQYRQVMKENKELDFKNTKLSGEHKELSILKEQYERRFGEMSQNHSNILTNLIEATDKATFLSKDNQQLVNDLKKISKKLVKTHFKTSIFNKYKDLAENPDQLAPSSSEDENAFEKQIEGIIQQVEGGVKSRNTITASRSPSKMSNKSGSFSPDGAFYPGNNKQSPFSKRKASHQIPIGRSLRKQSEMSVDFNTSNNQRRKSILKESKLFQQNNEDSMDTLKLFGNQEGESPSRRSLPKVSFKGEREGIRNKSSDPPIMIKIESSPSKTTRLQPNERSSSPSKTLLHPNQSPSRPKLSQDLQHLVSANLPKPLVPIYRDSKAVQFPDEFMLQQQETAKQHLLMKDVSNKFAQTDDLLDEDLLKQLREWRDERGGGMPRGLRGFKTNFGGPGGVTGVNVINLTTVEGDAKKVLSKIVLAKYETARKEFTPVRNHK